MKKGKKIKELDEWLKNSNDTEFTDNSNDVTKDYEEVNFCLLYTSDAADE